MCPRYEGNPPPNESFRLWAKQIAGTSSISVGMWLPPWADLRLAGADTGVDMGEMG
jgi:hypothetical protein